MINYCDCKHESYYRIMGQVTTIKQDGEIKGHWLELETADSYGDAKKQLEDLKISPGIKSTMTRFCIVNRRIHEDDIEYFD